MKTLECQIAAKASTLIQGQAGKNKETEYRSLCEEMPAMLRSAGLAQSLAFLRSKKEPHSTIYNHLEQHFRELKFLDTNQELLAHVLDPEKLSTVGYRTYTRLAHRIVYWHRRLAQALLKRREELAQPEQAQ